VRGRHDAELAVGLEAPPAPTVAGGAASSTAARRMVGVPVKPTRVGCYKRPYEASGVSGVSFLLQLFSGFANLVVYIFCYDVFIVLPWVVQPG
jgi:hypothetical protein